MASLSQGRTAAAQCGLFTHKSVPVIFEPPCIKIWSALRWNRAEVAPECSLLESISVTYKSDLLDIFSS